MKTEPDNPISAMPAVPRRRSASRHPRRRPGRSSSLRCGRCAWTPAPGDARPSPPRNTRKTDTTGPNTDLTGPALSGMTVRDDNHSRVNNCIRLLTRLLPPNPRAGIGSRLVTAPHADHRPGAGRNPRRAVDEHDRLAPASTATSSPAPLIEKSVHRGGHHDFLPSAGAHAPDTSPQAIVPAALIRTAATAGSACDRGRS